MLDNRLRGVGGILLMIAVTGVGCGAHDDRPPPKAPASPVGVSSEPRGPSGSDTPHSTKAADQVGLASWYGNAFAGRKTANGERFDPSKRTAAHRSLPFGTWVEVRRVDTGRTVRVRITDRGPYAGGGRIIDVSKRAAEELDMVRTGVTRVELRVVDGP
ncbi:Rare lipoprotein A precursor [Labilithrix luteola]|uniref:Probable endolytic peptidoglycan transglycosylase RlpA n=1 Tax=Labilithrix luteola TaxID=1391654 RepID=A0A0K1QBV5_9BACT|nr:septal ring lytic transglycosylase RlpA family protein [Labilithrix luteola]AKV02910.1 Rare lipoprotein A precursor [Labilithrix luteola]